MAIHPTAIIDRQAELDSSVEVGPYVVIEGPVKVGPRTQLRAHAYISGWTEIGERCDIHPFAVVGHLPQDVKYKGERSYCRIGNGVVIREGATVHRGTEPESATTIGDDCFIGGQSHIAHNCELRERVTLINYSALAGHVQIDAQVILSGDAMVHQFVRIGELAFIAGKARVTMDVPPFMMCFGDSTIIRHNVVGMRRAGYDAAALLEIREAYRTLYRSGLPFARAIEQLAGQVRTSAGRRLVEFLRAESKRGISAGGGIQHRRHGDVSREDETGIS